MRIPTDEEILALHKRYAPTEEALSHVWTHCLIVSRIAEQLHARSDGAADAELARAGSLVHDIGVYRLYDDAGILDGENYIRHGLLGHELLREEGLHETICRFASCHTGVGLSREDVLSQGLPLPPADYRAETTEELLVMYADKFHSKTNPPVFLTPASYAEKIGRFGTAKVAAFAAMVERFGEPDLLSFSREFGHALR
jgi:uncharacterized protein